MRKAALRLLLVAGSLVIIALGISLLVPGRPVPRAPLPVPNGYTNLVAAARLLSPDTSSFPMMDPGHLAALNRTNSAALALARTALQQECRVPLEFSTAYMSNHLRELSALKMLAQAFAAEAREAQMQERPAAAAESSLDCIRLGVSSGRGGVLIDQLVTLAQETLGTRMLNEVLPKLDAAACRTLAASLEELDSKRPSWEEIQAWERDWSSRTYSGIKYYIIAFATRKSSKAAGEKARNRYETHVSSVRNLTLALAARAFELEKGARPTNAGVLVPEYLKAVPVDPATGVPLQLGPDVSPRQP